MDAGLASDLDSVFHDDDDDGEAAAVVERKKDWVETYDDGDDDADNAQEEEDEDLPNGGVTPARPRLVVLVPTRELAAQVTIQARRIAFNTGLKTALLHGGQSVKPQLEELAQGPDILVSTPGRLLSCANDEPYLDLSAVTTLVIDEADQMLDMGFEPQVSEIIHRSGMPPPAALEPGGRRAGWGRQSLMFSATFPANVQRLASALVIGGGGDGLYGGARRSAGVRVGGSAGQPPRPPPPPPARVAVGRVGSTVAGIEQRIIPAENLRERKLELLVAVLRAVPESRTLVFCSVRLEAEHWTEIGKYGGTGGMCSHASFFAVSFPFFFISLSFSCTTVKS